MYPNPNPMYPLSVFFSWHFHKDDAIGFVCADYKHSRPPSKMNCFDFVDDIRACYKVPGSLLLLFPLVELDHSTWRFTSLT